MTQQNPDQTSAALSCHQQEQTKSRARFHRSAATMLRTRAPLLEASPKSAVHTRHNIQHSAWIWRQAARLRYFSAVWKRLHVVLGELQQSHFADSILRHTSSIWQAGSLYVCALIVYKLLVLVLTAVFILAKAVVEFAQLLLNNLLIFPMFRKKLQKGAAGLLLLCLIFILVVINFESHSSHRLSSSSAASSSSDWSREGYRNTQQHKKRPVHFPKTRKAVYDAYNDRIYDVINNVTREERHLQQVRDTQRLRNELIAEDLIGETDLSRPSPSLQNTPRRNTRRRKPNARRTSSDQRQRDVTTTKRPQDASISYKKIVPLDDVSVDDHFMRLLRNAQKSEKVFYNRVPKCGSEGVVAMIRSVAKQRGFHIERSHVHNERYLNESQQVCVT